MRLRKIASTAVLVLLLSLLAGTPGCWFGGERTAIEAMKRVPEGSTLFTYWDNKTLDGDKDLYGIYTKFRGSVEATQAEGLLTKFTDIKYSARASGFNQGSVTIFVGDFNLESIAAKLGERGYHEKEPHHDVKIWTPPSEQGYKVVALIEGTLIFSSEVEDLKVCIDAIKEQKYSLYGDSSTKEVMDKLPDGIVVDIYKTENYPDLLAYGMSYTKEDKDNLKLTVIYSFRDNFAAKNHVNDIKVDLEKDFSKVQVELKGDFVQASGLIDMDDFVQSLTW